MPDARDLWRVAALSMMAPEQLSAALQGESASDWVKAAANCGFAEAQVRLGRMLLEGSGIPCDPEAAFACFECASDSGDADAHNMLGRCFENGWGTAKDYTKAAHHYGVASDAGLDWAHYNLGHMLLSGSGVTRNRDAALACYAKAAAHGHVRAMNLLGRCYEEGWGVAADRDAARVWYRRSAFGGYFRGAYNYADMIAAEGCIHSAAHWFKCALETAPQPTQGVMLRALSRRPELVLRNLAVEFNRTDRTACQRPGLHVPEACASAEARRQNP
ncbi:MAG TPA: tetratricopeptide repeat protein [Rhizomicrobium sp.]|nr:tetratricopeptide repeat protein [Rhizomicrobium sp.]